MAYARTGVPAGFVDMGLVEAALEQSLSRAMQQTANLAGFATIRSPAIEFAALLETLRSRGPDRTRPSARCGPLRDEARQPFKLTDWGGVCVGLRYDLTAGLLRRVQGAAHRTPLPFRAFQSGAVWRTGKSAAGTPAREMFQCDVDLLGSTGPGADAEILDVACEVLESFVATDPRMIAARVHISDVRIIQGWLQENDLEDRSHRVLAVLARFPDTRRSACFSALRCEADLTDFQAGALLDFLAKLRDICAKPISEALAVLAADGSAGSLRSAAIDSLRHIDEELRLRRPINTWVALDPLLVRDLPYYSSTQIEIRAPRTDGKLQAVGGGGRYDRLARLGDGQPLPAVGFTICTSDLAVVLRRRLRGLVTRAFLIPNTPAERATTHMLAKDLRRHGISAQVPDQDARHEAHVRHALRIGAAYTVTVDGVDRFYAKNLIDNRRKRHRSVSSLVGWIQGSGSAVVPR